MKTHLKTLLTQLGNLRTQLRIADDYAAKTRDPEAPKVPTTWELQNSLMYDIIEEIDRAASLLLANTTQVAVAIRMAEKALEPLADRVHNDHGEMTVSNLHLITEAQACNAYVTRRRLSRALGRVEASSDDQPSS